jgi:histidinol-phosphatase (PHP family)
MGGKFTFSDDSHGIAQIATNYIKGLDYLESLDVKEVWTYERGPAPQPGGVQVKAELLEKSVSILAFRDSLKLA